MLALFCPCSSAVPEDSHLYRPLEAKVHPRPEEGYAETVKGIPGDLGKAPTSAHYTDHNCLILKEKETAGPKVGETLVPMDLNSGEHGDEAREGQKL